MREQALRHVGVAGFFAVLLAGTACALLPGQGPAPAPAAKAAEPQVNPLATPGAAADGLLGCDPRRPIFLHGFAFLKAQLQEKMGEAVECEVADPATGDTRQQTTTGTAYWRKTTNEASFTNGWDHWAWAGSEAGLLYWKGDVVDAPEAVPVVACPDDMPPTFTHGFAALKGQLGDLMGEPLTCVRYSSAGDALQRTSTGLARYTQATNTPSFQSGHDHWALTSRGVVRWSGNEADPPADAHVVDGAADLVASGAGPLGGVVPVVTPAPPTLPAPAPDVTLRTPNHRPWIEDALRLLWGYDKVAGTVFVPTLQRTTVDESRLRAFGLLGGFNPRTGRITLDSSLARESPQVIAAVLAHETTHAIDQAKRPPNTQVACYTLEISAFTVQARVWASFYGRAGKPDPVTDLEAEQNDILQQIRTEPGQFVSQTKDLYQQQCEGRAR